MYTNDFSVPEFDYNFYIDENGAILLGTAKADKHSAGYIVFGVGFGPIFFNSPLSNLFLSVRLCGQEFDDREASQPRAFRPHLDNNISVFSTDPVFPDRDGHKT